MDQEFEPVECHGLLIRNGKIFAQKHTSFDWLSKVNFKKNEGIFFFNKLCFCFFVVKQNKSWYRELCMKPGEENWKPGPVLITTKTRTTPYVLRLTWDNHPIYFLKGHGWGYLLTKEENGNNSFSIFNSKMLISSHLFWLYFYRCSAKSDRRGKEEREWHENAKKKEDDEKEERGRNGWRKNIYQNTSQGRWSIECGQSVVEIVFEQNRRGRDELDTENDGQASAQVSSNDLVLGEQHHANQVDGDFMENLI